MIAAAALIIAIVALRGFRGSAGTLTPKASGPTDPWTLASTKGHVDTLGAGESLDVLLRRGGLDGAGVAQVVAAASMLDPRRLPPGLPVAFERDNDSTPPTSLVFKLDVDRLVRVTRVDSTRWQAAEEHLPWVTDTVIVRGAVETNLYDALQGMALQLFPGGAHDALVFDIADVYKFRVDMTRELRTGDSVYAVVERSQGPESTTRVARILATRLFVAGRPIEAFYYQTASSRSAYYDDTGKSLSTAFLHAPIDFARVTSGFGMRFHPILKITRPHRGVDYGAVRGTPIHAIGDGIVVRAASDPGGFGNVVEVRHPNGFVTRYAHMSRFSAKAHRGTRVLQGDVIGYVGMTGLATAPHLHFEILIGGRQTSPTIALRNVEGTPLPKAARPAFDRERGAMLALLNHEPGVVHAVVTAN